MRDSFERLPAGPGRAPARGISGPGRTAARRSSGPSRPSARGSFSRVALCAMLALSASRAPLALPADPSSWKQVHTSHFTFYSDADDERMRAIATNLETFRAVLGRVGEKLRSKSSVPTVVFVFRNAQDFDPYKGDRPGDARSLLAGYFRPGSEANLVALDASAAQSSYRVVYHEFVHLMMSESFAKVPLCLNEGLAEFYSTFTCQNARAEIGQPVPEHVRWLQNSDMIPLDDLFSIQQDSREYNESSRVGVFYAESWALVHYILQGNPSRSGQLTRFLGMLQRSETLDQAFDSAFETTYAGLEKELSEYVRNRAFGNTFVDLVELKVPEPEAPRPVAPAEALYQLGNLLAQLDERSAGDAEEHFKAALSLDPDHARARTGLASLMRRQKRHEEAAVMLGEAEAIAPTDSQVLLATAKNLLDQAIGDRTSFRLPKEPPAEVLRARDLLKRVLEAEPDNVEANRALGITYLVGGDDPSGGIVALEKASRLAPLRADIAFSLLELYAREGNREKASALLEKRLRRSATPEMLQAAQELLLALDLRDAHGLIRQQKYPQALEILRRVLASTQNPDLKQKIAKEIPQLEAAAGTAR